ncbi:DUF4232 domain-containing protein [Streptomyces sp. NBC_00083]|uniref:DUF4232 domain-containing protein n=1 Tax=Streptomyces sp. NBC_00083 TaxID=2975647 RepID=UPI0022558B2C|nr:DUF4232 domain-containing protein [Streptomyces sp. NBC_00083]MCX5387243.1 DUF4232 domain-containing protein [Streptomyces sp. NBC_00083]
MHIRPSLVPALAATALLLTACGTEHAGAGGTGASAPSPRTGIDDPGKDGVRITKLTLPQESPTPDSGRSASVDGPPYRNDLVEDPTGDSGIAAAFEVTNTASQSLTYTVIVSFLSSDGGAMASGTATVRDVGPGKTMSGSVRAGHLPPSTPRVTRAKVLKVTKVPAGEAPAASGACPASGIRVGADDGDAAMGLRIVGLHLDNCGTRDYTVEGYPLLELLDTDLKTVHGIRILAGSGEITTGAGPDEKPRRVTLKPGESAHSSLVWRNTTEAGPAVNVPYVRVRAKAGAEPVTVTPNLDLGTTGKLGVRPWEKADPAHSAGTRRP